MQFLVEADLVQRVDGRDPIIGLSGANLSNADLRHATLSHANLSVVDLHDANLSFANLSGAEHITNEELAHQAKSLEGATMPDGQKYEDWLKEREEEPAG